MDYKKILTEIQNEHLETFCLLTDFKDKDHCKKLPTKHRGLYWIWSSHSFEDLQKIPTMPNTKEVPIDKLVRERQDLNNINRISLNGFTIVYNGIGGYIKEPASSGLRERINQELNCTNSQTGTLNLSNRKCEFVSNKNWGVSYFDFDNENNSEIIAGLNYQEHANTIEMNWRIEYGIPILTRF